jgi:hypothetical protein
MGVSMAEVAMEDMANGNPASLSAQLGALGLVPRHSYSAIAGGKVLAIVA